MPKSKVKQEQAVTTDPVVLTGKKSKPLKEAVVDLPNDAVVKKAKSTTKKPAKKKMPAPKVAEASLRSGRLVKARTVKKPTVKPVIFTTNAKKKKSAKPLDDVIDLKAKKKSIKKTAKPKLAETNEATEEAVIAPVKPEIKSKAIDDDVIAQLLGTVKVVEGSEKPKPAITVSRVDDETEVMKELEESDKKEELSDEEIKLTPKIRVSKISELSDKVNDFADRNMFSSDFVVDLKTKRTSYVDEADDVIDDEINDGANQVEQKVVLAPEVLAEVAEDASILSIPPEGGPSELDDLLPMDEKIANQQATDLPQVEITQAVPVVELETQSEKKATVDSSPAAPAKPAVAKAESEPAKPEAIKAEPELKIHKPHNLKIYKRLAIAFSVVVLLVLIGVLYFTMVKATISLALKEQSATEQAVVQIYDRPADFALPDKSVRGIVKLVSIEQSKLYQVSGNDVIGEEVIGQITLFNKYNKSQPLVASTRLLSASGKLFRLKNSVTVPAGGQVVADVYADVAKPESAVGAELFTVPGLWEGLQDKIYGESVAGAIKYQQKLRRIITQDDIDKALIDLKQVLQDKIKADFDNAYNDYDHKIYRLDEATLQYTVSGKVGEEKEQLPVSMKGSVEVIAFNNAQAQEIAKTASAAKLPAGQDLLAIDNATVKYDLTKFDPSMVMAEINLTYNVSMRANSKNSIIDKNKIIGLSEDQLKQYLTNIKDIRTYTIEFYPSFIKQVPRLTDRIEIKVIE